MVLAEARQTLDRRYGRQSRGWDFEWMLTQAAGVFDLPVSTVRSAGTPFRLTGARFEMQPIGLVLQVFFDPPLDRICADD
jgi:hypothetical protein